MPAAAPLQDPRIRNMAQEGQAFQDELVALMVEAGMDEAEARAIVEDSVREPGDDEVVAMAVPPDAEAAMRRGDRAEALRIVQAAMDLDPAQAVEVVAAMEEPAPMPLPRRAALDPPVPLPDESPAAAPPSFRWIAWVMAALVVVAGLVLLT